jgi:hypothetical protein
VRQQQPAVQTLLSGGLEGAEPAYKSAAPGGQSPPESAEGKEQPNAENLSPGGPCVNGHADPFPYSDTEAGIIWHKSRDQHIRITNFKARIIGDVSRDDGVEATRHYEIAATLGERPYRFEIGANQFRNVAGWVAEKLGAGAIVEPGPAMEARVRHAIQTLSGEGITEKHIYAHTGWREIDGQMRFLHSGGALGKGGHCVDIEVDLPGQLSRYELIEPEDKESLQKAVRRSLLLMTLAPPRVMAAALGAVYRAPIGSSDITVGLYGGTGHGKTEMAALLQQHYGPGMDARNLPLAWESTANVIEDVLSAGKDVLVVVDEYVPGENSVDRARLQAKADRVIRAQGNATGRGRMRPDGTLRRVKPPRGQLLSTGEEVPAGQSLRARMMTVEVRQGEINWASMSKAQAAAAAGEYSTAAAGFVMWLANDLEAVRKFFQARRLQFRDKAEAEHKRTADVVAQLAAAWCLFLSFAMDVGAIDEREAERLEGEVWAGLIEGAAEQSELQRAAEPVSRFRDLIVAALGTGRAHVASADTGRRPDATPDRWGWARDLKGDWSPHGDCIGWITAQGHLYLEPDVAYAVASKIGSISISAETLSARMADAGVTVFEHEGKRRRRRHRPKRQVSGVRRRVLHIRTIDWLYPADSGASGADGANTEKEQVPQEVAPAPF